MDEDPKVETEGEEDNQLSPEDMEDGGSPGNEDDGNYNNNEEDDTNFNANESPDRESPMKDNAEANGNDEPQRDQESPLESPEGQAVYDRHQLDGQNYEEQEGEDYQYDEEAKNGEYNQEEEETKRLYDENEEEIQPVDREHEHEVDDEDPIQKKIRAIIELCEQTNGMYGDSDFPPNDASLYFNPAEPPDYAEGTPVVEWMRPEEALKSGDSDKVAMIKNGMKPGDVKQGTLGDCWLLGSLMVLGTHPELLQNLIVKDCIKYGFAVFQFFKNGEWKQVLVDTRIPYNRETKTPLYGHCADPTEVWVPLMEKAYAKMHGCYQALNGGSMSEALVDLTGGVSEKVLLESPETIEIRDNGVLWKELVKYYQQGYLLGCSKKVADEDGNPEEGMGNQGIQYNHAYGILDIRLALGIQLIRIRNPWGYAEWTGRYADEDEAWDDSKGLKEELNYAFEDDGTWWMRYDDWYMNYNQVYVCKIFPAAWQQFSIQSKWEGNTAGGPYPPMIDRDETTGVHSQLDTNDKWFNNPQFRLSVTKKTQVYISLMQEDEKISKKPYIPVNFIVVRVFSKRQRLWEVDKDDVVVEAARGAQRFGQREVCVTCWLQPIHDKKPVHYIIVPNTEVDSKKDEERPFVLRIFTSERVDLIELPKTIEQTFTGKWVQSTAGGRRILQDGGDNKHWCRNPQYFLNLKKPTHLKVILRKKGGKKIKGVTVGLCVTKAFPPTTRPAAKIKKDGQEIKSTKGAATTMTKAGKSSKKGFKAAAITYKSNIKEDNFPEIVPPELGKLERKLQILPNEWYIESQYKNEDVAAIYSFWKPTNGPFLIVPSLQLEGFTSDYTLTIFSSSPVEVEKLDDAKNMVISGEWNDKTAGGCHLYDRAYETLPDNFTWINNPKFKLNLYTTQKTHVKITLSRPEIISWKKQIAISAVDCMIGFYVYPCNVTPTKENCISKMNFVPMNEYSETIELDGNPEGYLIMPTTYKPKCKGPFVIAVSTDVEFSLDIH